MFGGHGDNSFATNIEVSDSLKTIDNLKKAKELLHIVGRFEEDQFLDESIIMLVKNFSERYIDGYKVVGDLQTPQAYAIDFGLFEKEKKQAVEYLVELIRNTNNHLQAGVMGYRCVLKVLAENGYAELAYKLITQKTWPSWGNLIEQGATTLWEHFTEFVYTERGVEQKDGTERLWSLNHSAFGGVSKWFYNYIAGIKVKSAKFVEISPIFISGINNVNASFNNLGNEISVSWKRIGETCEIVINNDGFDGEIKIKGKNRPLGNGKTTLTFYNS